MATKINGANQIQAGTVTRALHNTSTSGSAVITKIIAGSNITISSTGADSGTGDVTVNAISTVSRTTKADTNYAATSSDQIIAYTSLTATRTVTLPTASSYPPSRLLIIDESGSASLSVAITIVPNSTSDFINGTSSVNITSPYGYIELESNGSHNWTISDKWTLGMAQQAPSAVAITGGTIDGVLIGGTNPPSITSAGVQINASNTGGFGPAWNGKDLTVGQSGTSGSGSGRVALRYDATAGIVYFGAVIPLVAWLPINMQFSSYNLTINGGSSTGLYINSSASTFYNQIIAPPGSNNGLLITNSLNTTTQIYDDNNGHLESGSNLWINGNTSNNVLIALGGGYISLGKSGAKIDASGNLNASTLLVNNATTNSVNGGQLGGFRNLIINPAFMIDQRYEGGSITVAPNNSGVYFIDRFSYSASNNANFNGVFSKPGTSVSLGNVNQILYSQTSTAATVAAGDYLLLDHKIEGINSNIVMWPSGKSVTLSFYASATVGGTYAISIQNYNASMCYVATYTLTANVAKLITLTIPAPPSGTWGSTVGSIGIWVRWVYACGSTYKTSSPNTWSSTAYFSATGCVDIAATANATLSIFAPQLEVGTVATSFEFRSAQIELVLCQRYFEKSYNVGEAVGGATSNAFQSSTNGRTSGSLVDTIMVPFKATKMASPTITTYSNNSPYASNKAYDNVNNATVTTTYASGGNQAARFIFTTSANSTSTNFTWCWTAAAEL